MEDMYPKAYKEVIEILKFMPQESICKIPQIMIDTFKEKMDKNYNFSIDVNKKFEEQELLAETKSILANIFRDYWATKYQKEKILEKEKYDRRIIEERKRKDYPHDNLFNKKQEYREKQLKEIKNTNSLIEVKKENRFKKIINLIKRIFHKRIY